MSNFFSDLICTTHASITQPEYGLPSQTLNHFEYTVDYTKMISCHWQKEESISKSTFDNTFWICIVQCLNTNAVQIPRVAKYLIGTWLELEVQMKYTQSSKRCSLEFLAPKQHKLN